MFAKCRSVTYFLQGIIKSLLSCFIYCRETTRFQTVFITSLFLLSFFLLLTGQAPFPPLHSSSLAGYSLHLLSKILNASCPWDLGRPCLVSADSNPWNPALLLLFIPTANHPCGTPQKKTIQPPSVCQSETQLFSCATVLLAN